MKREKSFGLFPYERRKGKYKEQNYHKANERKEKSCNKKFSLRASLANTHHIETKNHMRTLCKQKWSHALAIRRN